MTDPPSGRVPEQGPDWFLVATEACGRRTPDLGYVLEVSGYIRGVGVGNKSGGSITSGLLHYPGALHDEEGVAHPRG